MIWQIVILNVPSGTSGQGGKSELLFLEKFTNEGIFLERGGDRAFFSPLLQDSEKGEKARDAIVQTRNDTGFTKRFVLFWLGRGRIIGTR